MFHKEQYGRIPLYPLCICICMRLSFILSGHLGRVLNNEDMRTHTLNIMAGLERRMNTYTRKVELCSGSWEDMKEVHRVRERLMKYAERKIESLSQKAGEA